MPCRFIVINNTRMNDTPDEERLRPLLMIGLDAAEFKLIQPMMAEA